MSMIMVIMAASVPLISRQQTNKISKGRNQTGTVSLNGTHGHFACYYDANGALRYKQVWIGPDNEITKTITDESGSAGADNCYFEIPDGADLYEIVLAGGGGGGAGSVVYYNYNKKIAEDYINAGYKKITIGNQLKSHYNVINENDLKSGFRKLVNNIKIYIDNPKNTSPSCGYTVDNVNNYPYNEPLEFTYGKEADTYVVKGEKITSPFYSNATEGCKGNIANEQVPSDSIVFAITTAKGKEIKLSPGDSLKIYLRTLALTYHKTNPGEPGQVVKYNTAFIDNNYEKDGKKVLKIPKENIGIGGTGSHYIPPSGGSGVQYVKTNGNGGNTQIKLNDKVTLTATGGTLGVDNKEEVVSTDLIEENNVIPYDGKNGKKSRFAFPSALGIDETGLTIAHASYCNANNCSVSEESKYPGSSGASAGFKITKSKKGIARMEVEIGNQKEILFPEEYTQEVPYGIYGTGGKGANGAILISW